MLKAEPFKGSAFFVFNTFIQDLNQSEKESV